MFEFTLKLIWIILSIFLIFIIFSRVPKNQGLTSFATKSDLLGSPNSTESFFKVEMTPLMTTNIRAIELTTISETLRQR